jgi:glycosyltransferase involved in cell wall biosynthesis
MVSKTSMQESQKSYPSISIITPTYNSAKTLSFCLDSIKNQDYNGDIEIIIANGGSTDSTLEIAQKYTDKIYPNPLMKQAKLRV